MRLNHINSEWFVDLTNLTHLYLWSNEISEIPNGAFRNQVKLRVLHVGSNKISRLNSFGTLPLLNRFTIDANILNEIEPNFFQNFPVLNVFDAARGNICIVIKVLEMLA